MRRPDHRLLEIILNKSQFELLIKKIIITLCINIQHKIRNEQDVYLLFYILFCKHILQ